MCVVLRQDCSDLFQLQQETQSLGVTWGEASDDQDRPGHCSQVKISKEDLGL